MSARVAGSRRWVWAGGAALLGGAGMWWALSAGQDAAKPLPASAGAQATSHVPVAAKAQAALTAASAAQLASVAVPAASAAQARAPAAKVSVETLRKTGSLRGTELDGDWGQFVGGVLKPGFRLRQRFDHLLIGLGEVDERDLRAWIAEQAQAAHGDKGAEQLLAVWDAYEKLLRSQVGGKAADPTDPVAWQRWLAERVAARSAALGPAWAEAFYGEEHQGLKDFGARMVQRAAAGPGAMEPEAAAQKALLPTGAVLDSKAVATRHAQRVQYFGEEGAQRLAAEDKAWADWHQRIHAAQMRRQQIAADMQLSEPQRQQAYEADLARHFQGTDLLRARGLVRG